MAGLPRQLLGQTEELREFLTKEKPDYLYHLSSFGNMYHQTDEQEIFKANVVGTWNLLTASKDIPYKAFVNFSTSKHIQEQATFYGAGKAAGTYLACAVAKNFNKPIVTIEPYSIYGPGEADFRFIPTVFRSCIKGDPMVLSPNAAHDWVYIEDFVVYLINIAQAVAIHEAFDVQEFGSGKSVSNQYIVHVIEKIVGKKANIKEQKTLRSFDTGSWHAEYSDTTTSLEEGLRKTYEYYKKKYEEG